MTKTAVLLALIVTALAGMPAHAQVRVFVSAHGLDSNPCTVTQPCRTFQQAYNTVPANGEIDVLDPAGYGPLTITHGISIQAHGFSGITAASGDAIDINVTTTDPVTLNGLLIEGEGIGAFGIRIASGPFVQILNCIIRHFSQGGIDAGASTSGASLLIEDTVVSDNLDHGIAVRANTGASLKATLNRVTVSNNPFGVQTFNLATMTIANSVISNNTNTGLIAFGGVTYLAKTVISGNPGNGVFLGGGPVNSYGDNYIKDNGTPVGNGSLTPVTTQ
jgi:hypothetical protein